MLLTSGLTKYINITGEDYHPKVCTITHSYFVLLNGNEPNSFYKYHNNNNNNINNINNTFDYYIHGLWPEQCLECPECGYPTFCGKQYHSIDLKQNIIKELIEYWFPPNNITAKVELIEHEYSKHGVCFQNLTAMEYFAHVIRLYKEVKNNQTYAQSCIEDQCMFNIDTNFNITGPIH